MKTLSTLFLILGVSVSALHANIKFLGFDNESKIQFEETFSDGRDFDEGVVLGKEGGAIRSKNGHYKIIFEDAQKSGFHRPHWKYNVWIKTNHNIPFFKQNKLLYAVIFYDGEGEVKLHMDKEGKLHVLGGYDVADVLYPWAKSTIGRGNPYHEIAGQKVDSNGVKYFDSYGFVGFKHNHYHD